MSIETHLALKATTLCRCWSLTRSDGLVQGFTDHDGELSFEGISFQPSTGLTGKALSQTTGLSVDNSEVYGALSDASITEADILAGRYDGAVIVSWLVNWELPDERQQLFKATIGEVTRADGAFTAELRGAAEALNVPLGRVYQKRCVSGDGEMACGIDLNSTGFFVETAVEVVEDESIFTFTDSLGFDDRWFEGGKFEVVSGAAAGLFGLVKTDRLENGERRIELWQQVQAPVFPGDMLRIFAGYDGLPETCRIKFNNFNEFRGFPHIPGEDWVMAYPRQSGTNNGGSRYK